MVEFFEGSGFYPPTLNSFIQSAGGTSQLINNSELTFTITADDRVELSSLTLFHRHESGGGTGNITVTVKIQTSIITNYVYAPANGIYLDTLIQNTSIVLNKNDKITFNILGSGQNTDSRHTISLVAFGKYVL